MTNFGVELFLNTFLEYARKPPGRAATCALTASGSAGGSGGGAGAEMKEDLLIQPEYDEFSGFVFKLQVNIYLYYMLFIMYYKF